MNTRLILKPEGGGASTELPRQGRLLIGSDPERADYVIEGAGIDGLHCAIGRLKGGSWAIKDLGSRFGTSVNGQPASASRLSAGDVIVLGSRRLLVIDPTAESQANQTAQQETSQPAPVAPIPTESPAEVSPDQEADAPKGPQLSSRQSPPTIPGYTIRRYLGRGASGTVWLARQESLAREVALKVLSPKRAQDADFVARFQGEARAAAALNHPNVVHIYDVGAANGFHYLSMEFMDQGCLEIELVLNGPLPWRKTLEVISDAARGLSYAQSQGLLHRDIKPANLMRGSDGRTRLADLGLATSIEAVEVDGTQDGQRTLVGTPQFLAPEVVRGDPASPASDLYSLGATAYRLLSGHTPFEAERTADVLRSVLRDEPESLASRVPGLPAPVASLVHRMLAKDPDARPASAGVVVTEIENIQHGRASSNLEGIKRGSRASRGPLIVLTVVIAAFLAWYFANLKGQTQVNDPEDPNSAISRQDSTGGGSNGQGNPGDNQSGVAPDTTSQDPIQAPLDDDAAEQAFEAQAQRALLALEAQTLTDDQRVAALRDLALEWAGSSTAQNALETADALEIRRGEDHAADEQLVALREALLKKLRAAASFDPSEPQLAPILTRMEEVPGQFDFTQDIGFRQGRQAILSDLLDGALARAEAAILQSANLQKQGNFEALPELLQNFIDQLGLPAEDPTEDPRLTLLRQRSMLAKRTLQGLDAIKAAHNTQRATSDESRVMQAFAGTGSDTAGLLADLQAGKLSQVDENLGILLASVKTLDLLQPLAALRADVQAGQRSLAMLSASFNSPGWRRQTVLDLRDGQESYEVVACDANGPQVLVDGTLSHLGWAPFLASARGMQHLFDRRLERSLNTTEKADIDAFLRLAAVLECLAVARELLEREVVTERRMAELIKPFGQAQLSRAADLPPEEAAKLTLEEDAAKTLALGLRALSSGQPLTAQTHLERLANEFPSSLFLLLLETLPADS